ncbi:MAG: hypothetical protein R6X09_11455 [Bacteroidales bacterium]
MERELSDHTTIAGDSLMSVGFESHVAGSTAVALAESEIGAPAIGMCVGGITNLGNSYIRGARGTDLLDAAASGTLWGGVSGFAMMGFSEIMGIPVNVKTGSGLIEPFTGRPQTVQITLGEWLFGTQSSNISNIIANQGRSNLTMVLTIPVINLISMPLSVPQPMYLNSYLDFSGDIANYTGVGQYVNGTLDWFDYYSDGSSVNRGSWTAVSGPWGSPIARGRHTIQNGQMGLDTGIPGYIRDGADFYIDIFPDPSYEIHPDGNAFGTMGCIGIRESGVRSLDLYNRIRTYTRRYNVLQLNVNY